MRAILGTGIAISFLLISGHVVRAEEAPGAILEKAIKAMGGRDVLQQAKAMRMKTKGVLHSGDYNFVGELVVQFPGQEKHSIKLNLQGTTWTLVQSVSGQRAWSSENGKVKEAEPSELTDMQQSAYVNYVSTLLPLVEDKGYTISKLGESQVKDRPAVGIKVARAGKPDVQLYFDRESGLLVKTEHRHLDGETKKQVIEVQFLSDYREIDPAVGAEASLKQAKVGRANEDLLGYVRQRTVKDEDRANLGALIRKLGDSSFEVREMAKESLIKLGAVAVPLLTQATKDADAEVSGRAKECLQQIGKSSDSTTLVAVLRLLAVRKPPGVIETLLAYLPSAPDETVANEARAALAVVGFHDGKPDKALVKALEDKDAARRAAVAAILGQDGKANADPAGRPLVVFGLKQPTKLSLYHDGARYVEWEVTDVQLYNRFDDTVFAQP